MTRTVLQFLFWLALAVWTVLLVWPTPKEAVEALTEWSDILPLLVAKSLHISGYAGFAVGALVLFRRRWWVFAAVGGHAILGEVGQFIGNELFGTNRVGTVKDVLIDWGGMAIGCGVWWVWRRVFPSRTVREKSVPGV